MFFIIFAYYSITEDDMIIRFEEKDMSLIPNFKGGEKEISVNMFFDGTNRILKGLLVPGASIGIHTHDDSCEVIFILEGKGAILEKGPDDTEESVKSVTAGDCIYCPKGHTHSLMNDSDATDLVFYGVVPLQ